MPTNLTPRLMIFAPHLRDEPPLRRLVALANALVGAGVAVDLVSPMGGGPLRATLDPRVGQIDLAKRHVATSMLALARVLSERRPVGLVAAAATGWVATGAAVLARTGVMVLLPGRTVADEADALLAACRTLVRRQ